MREGLYEIVNIERSNHGKWVFTARPINGEITFECDSLSLEDELFKYARESLWLYLDENHPYHVLSNFKTVNELDEEDSK